jgi:hypothetical protein
MQQCGRPLIAVRVHTVLAEDDNLPRAGIAECAGDSRCHARHLVRDLRVRSLWRRAFNLREGFRTQLADQSPGKEM